MIRKRGIPMRLPFSASGRVNGTTGETSATPAITGEMPVPQIRLPSRQLFCWPWFSLALFVLMASTGGVAIRPHVWAWYHRREARVELQRYHTPQAIRHLLICRAIWPHDAETLLLAARAARRARIYGDSEHLLRDYRQVHGCDEAYIFERLLLTTECCIDE